MSANDPALSRTGRRPGPATSQVAAASRSVSTSSVELAAHMYAGMTLTTLAAPRFAAPVIPVSPPPSSAPRRAAFPLPGSSLPPGAFLPVTASRLAAAARLTLGAPRCVPVGIVPGGCWVSGGTPAGDPSSGVASDKGPGRLSVEGPERASGAGVGNVGAGDEVGVGTDGGTT